MGGHPQQPSTFDKRMTLLATLFINQTNHAVKMGAMMGTTCRLPCLLLIKQEVLSVPV